MCFKSAIIAGACALAIALPAAAQIEDTGLGAIDPWGMGFLERGEPALPTNMWRASRADDLLPSIRRVRTRGLTPAERTLMRRMALSPAARPNGKKAAELLAERARIMFELGEAEAAAALMERLDTPPQGLNAEEIAADLNLALGNEATACRPVTQNGREGAYWAKLRAVCAALQGNNTGAELAIELAQQQGVNDSWLFSAVYAASGDVPSKPAARFDSGIHLAISTKAGLTPSQSAVSRARPDLAAAMATRTSLPPALRAKAADIAADAGLISPQDHRAAYTALLSEPDFKVSGSVEEALAKTYRGNRPNPRDHARVLAGALRASRGSAARFGATSRLLKPDIDRLPHNSQTSEYALIFARASLAAGDARAAGRWSGGTYYEGARSIDPFELAYIDGLVILAGADRSPASLNAISKDLIGAARSTDQKRSAARLISLWTGFGAVPSSEARALIDKYGGQNSSNAPPGRLIALRGAARAGAAGEVILGTVGLTNGDPARLDPVDLSIIFEALGRIKAEDAARQLALEATGYWKR